MANRIRQTVGAVHGFLRFLRTEPSFMRKLSFLKNTKKKIVVLGTPIHGNIGDHLIAAAESQFFHERFSNYKYVDCTMPFSRYFLPLVLNSIGEEDYLMVSGGGWLGSEWKTHEVFVRKIVSSHVKGHVVILPQTVFYKELDEFALAGAKIYHNCYELFFCVRDELSFEFLKNNHFCDLERLFLMPDFALFYEGFDLQLARENIINVCFRNDIEVSIDTSVRNQLLEILQSDGYSVREVTTNIRGKLIKQGERENAIKDKIKEIANCKLLVTDRLHAMIMAAISGTPCIAFDNATHKVAGVYKWIKYLDYIHLYEKGENLDLTISKLLSCSTENRYDRTPLNQYFDELEKKLMSM